MVRWLVTRMEQYGPRLKVGLMALIVLLIAAITWFVWITGGIKFVYSHSMYIPVVLAALVFGISGAVPVAILAALALGPWMPVDTVTGEMQPTINWLYRTAIFLLIAIIIGSASDLLRAYVKRIQWRLFHDPSTELPNRNALLNDLDANLSQQHRASGQALVLINLDDLQDYELRLGNHFGTGLMCQLHKRYSRALGSGVSVYQSGRNQVALLVHDETENPVDAIIGMLDRLMLDPVHFDHIPVLLSFHTGVVHTRELLLGRAEEYLQKAEICLSRARQTRQRHMTYEEVMDGASRENIEVLGRFKQAFDGRRLLLHYQPKIRLADKRLVGSEALLRWRTADGRDIPPGHFIPQVEQSSLIHTLTNWVIEQSLIQYMAWQKEGIPCGPVAVNISPLNLLSRHFVSDIMHLLYKHGLDGDVLELEVTETAFMDDIQQSARKLLMLSREGIRISIDDYGTGYSSLQYLDRLPVSALKLDRIFINKLGLANGNGHARYNLVEHTIQLAHSLDMTVVAEGVETAEISDMLRDMGCELAQGYHFSRPLPPEQFRAYCQSS